MRAARPDRVAALVAAGVAVGWGTIGPLVRQVDLPAVSIAWSRVALGAACLTPLVLRDRARGRTGDAPWGRSTRARVLAAGTLLGLHWLALLAALQRAPVGTVLLIVYLAPVLVALAAPRVLGERLAPGVGWALAVAVAGAALVVGPGASGVAPSGLVLAGVAAVTYAAIALIDKSIVTTTGPLRLALAKMAIATVVLGPLAALAEWGPPRTAWTWLLVLGAVHTAGGLVAFLWALHRLPATEAGILAELEPVAGAVFGWVLLGEEVGWATLVGGLLVVAAGAIVVRSGSAGALPEPVAAGEPSPAGAAPGERR